MNVQINQIINKNKLFKDVIYNKNLQIARFYYIDINLII